MNFSVSHDCETPQMSLENPPNLAKNYLKSTNVAFKFQMFHFLITIKFTDNIRANLPNCLPPYFAEGEKNFVFFLWKTFFFIGKRGRGLTAPLFSRKILGRRGAVRWVCSDTLGLKLKICRWNCHKNQQWQNFRFFAKFGVFRG